jgi:hypothetical protein
MRARISIVVLILGCTLAAVPAFASPQSDFDGVYADWKADKKVTPCRWKESELQNAYDLATGNPDFQYETSFQDDVKAELKRTQSGGCAGVAPIATRKASALAGLRVTSVSGRGAVAKESVRMKNTTRKTISLRKASLRNAKKAKAVFPAGFRLKPGKTAVVHLGCAAGKRTASSKGTTVWLCRRTQFFRDKGDVAGVADAKGVVVTQRGFGSLKSRAAF